MAHANTFSAHHEEHDGAVVFYCKGSLTAEHSWRLKDEVKKWVSKKRITLDFREVDRMDSSGLGAVVGLYISARKQNCEFLLVNYGESIRDLLGMSHLLNVFEAYGRSGTRSP